MKDIILIFIAGIVGAILNAIFNKYVEPSLPGLPKKKNVIYFLKMFIIYGVFIFTSGLFIIYYFLFEGLNIYTVAKALALIIILFYGLTLHSERCLKEDYNLKLNVLKNWIEKLNDEVEELKANKKDKKSNK